jgi:hypothetical protein
MTEPTIQELWKVLHGQEVLGIYPNPTADEGFVIRFKSGIELEAGWSGAEGGCSIRYPVNAHRSED